MAYQRAGLRQIAPKQCIILSDAYRRFGDCIARTSGRSAGHCVCLKDGTARDAWDSRSRWVDYVYVPKDRCQALMAQEGSRDRMEVKVVPEVHALRGGATDFISRV